MLKSTYRWEFALLLILGVAVYTWLVRRKNREIWWGWWTSVISGSFSVLLGVVFGLWMFSFQEGVKAEGDRDRYLRLLRSELEDSCRVISGGEPAEISTTGGKFKATITYIQPIVIEDAARSGLFSDLITENLLHLARKFRMYNTEVQFLLNALASSNLSQSSLIQFAARNLNSTNKALREDIPMVAAQLGLQSLSCH